VTISQDVYEAGACLHTYLAMPEVEAPAMADAVIVLGSKYTDVPRFAGALCARQRYPVVVFSGNRGRNTGNLPTTEAELFERIARPFLPAETRVFLEKEATNTGENVRFSLRLLAEQGITCSSLVSIQNAAMARRVLTTFVKQFPDLAIVSLSPDRPYDDYLASPASARSFLDDLVGNLQRMLVYPGRGLQVEAPVPQTVLDAYRLLLSRGFDRQLLESHPFGHT
jgi:uncharacterized SAM-binding protein YcdF (DUF218 family)